MHFERTNLKFGYFMNDSANKITELKKTNREKDLYFTSDIDCQDHIRKVTARTNKILGSIKKSFVCRDSGLYASLVRPNISIFQISDLLKIRL